MYKNVSLPLVATFQSSWILLAINLVVGPNLPLGGLACGLVLGPVPSNTPGYNQRLKYREYKESYSTLENDPKAL